jgi:hypothetical protein
MEENINDYWKQMMDIPPPVFTNIDWTQNNDQSSSSGTAPMEYEKTNSTFQHQPFARRRSSSVDLPINPLYLNTAQQQRFNSNEATIQEESGGDFFAFSPLVDDFDFTRMNRIGSSAVCCY